MTIDTDELRRKLRSDDLIDHIDIHSNVKPVLTEILDRLEAAEKERDALRARIEQMERQEPCFADAYQGAMEEVAIWKKRALEAEDLNRKFIAEINGPTHMGEPAQPMPSVPDSWKLVPEKHPTFDPVDLQLSDGSVLCGCVPQADGDYWWEGPSGEVFIDPKYASVTHWRLAAAP